MRIAVLLALSSAILCSSCAASSTITAQAELPPTVAAPPEPLPSAPVQLENLGKKVKFRGPVTLQIGTGNNVTVPPPAPSSPPQKERGVGVPWQLIAGAFVAVALVFTWLGAKLASKLRWLPFLGLLLCLTYSPAQAQRQLVIPSSKHSWREARTAQRRYNRVVRYYRRQNRRDNREAAAELRRRHKLLHGLGAKLQTQGK